jgi:hypothetical protein
MNPPKATHNDSKMHCGGLHSNGQEFQALMRKLEISWKRLQTSPEQNVYNSYKSMAMPGKTHS